MVVDGNAAGDGLQILGHAVGVDLRFLNLVVHHDHLLYKGHLEVHSLIQHTVGDLSHSDDHAGVSCRDNGDCTDAHDQHQENDHTQNDTGSHFCIFHNSFLSVSAVRTRFCGNIKNKQQSGIRSAMLPVL